MRIAVYDETDDLFAHLVVTVAKRRGHSAKRIDAMGDIATAFASPPSAIILGIEQLDDRALERVTQLREDYQHSLIFVTAENPPAQAVIAGLQKGATDVLHRPILPQELLVRAELARPVSPDGIADGAVRVADLEVDLDRVRAAKAGRDLNLTRLELRLLYCLVQHHGRVAPTERLVTFGWDTDEPSPSTLKTHVSHLRQKLREAGGEPIQIRSRQMLGYILETANVTSSAS